MAVEQVNINASSCEELSKLPITDEQRDLEQWMVDNIDYDPYGLTPQPEIIKQSVRLAWLKWAHMHGDMSYVPYTPDKKPFGVEYVTYHEEE